MPNFRRWLAVGPALLVILAACATPPVGSTSRPSTTASASVAASPGPSASEAARPTTLPGCASLEAPADEGRAHLRDGVTHEYGSYPPTSGPHAVTPADPGWYEVMPPVEQLVHSLEHGFVVVYRSGLDAADEAPLKTRFDDLVAEGFGGLISVPDASIKDPMTLTAWDRLQRCVRAEPDAFEGFVRAHYAQAPEASVACALPGAATLPACEAIASSSPVPTRAPTAADTALLARIPEGLRAACRPTTAFAEGADAGWDCIAPSAGFAYGYSGFPTAAARDAFFESIASALDARDGGDCAAGDAVVERFSRRDGTTGRLVCSTTGTTRSFYWAVDGGSDLGIAVALDDTDLRAFFETAGPKPSTP